jgi:uncharacterized sporulation protein YeaH/YhbH (DUF444 family)
MSVSQHDWSLHRKGQVDQERHQEKIREAIKKNLSDIVSEESIILSDGKKMVRVPIRSLDEYRFRFDPGRQTHAGEGDGKSKVGDVVAQEPRPGKGKKGDAGRDAGYDYYDAEVTTLSRNASKNSRPRRCVSPMCARKARSPTWTRSAPSWRT